MPEESGVALHRRPTVTYESTGPAVSTDKLQYMYRYVVSKICGPVAPTRIDITYFANEDGDLLAFKAVAWVRDQGTRQVQWQGAPR